MSHKQQIYSPITTTNGQAFGHNEDEHELIDRVSTRAAGEEAPPTPQRDLAKKHAHHKADRLHLFTTFDQYATRKTIATGFFNVALLSTNFGQLKQVVLMLQHKGSEELAATSTAASTSMAAALLALICTSVLLQLVLGMVLVFVAKQGEFMDEEKRETLIRSNNAITILAMAISIINVFINVFIASE